MEGMVRFSKLKLHIHSIIAENKALRRHREAEAEFSKKLQELQAELASRDELQRKLETKMENLENDNILLEKKQKELRDTLDNLLKSRDAFIKAHEGSACSLKNAIIVKDKQLNVLSNKVQRHLSLFDSIEKEAEALKGTVGQYSTAFDHLKCDISKNPQTSEDQSGESTRVGSVLLSERVLRRVS
ncbi:unnamed protein product [Spirodela intermedia]|uniref:Uncharacterized protein n=1 Tax=Spirodela intermedia TaxID=51605 RepID=A0A7I8I9C1_SPIIN|nr:unnamed protein product [Spirodela intermedia]CAA6653662.1 unnamed protein product [Spirodela intermedia]